MNADGSWTRIAPFAAGMVGIRTSILLVIMSPLFCGCLTVGGSETEPEASYQRWEVYSGDWAGTKYSSLDQVNRSNVQRLGTAWRFRTGDSSERPASTIECNPIVIKDVMYLTSPALKLIALEAATGREIWRFDPFAGRPASGVNRGVTYWKDEGGGRIFYVAGPYLHAIDAATGKPIAGFGQGGRIELSQGLDRDTTDQYVTATTPAAVFEDFVIVGTAVGEGPGPAAPGHIRAFDARTGERRWIFHTIPHPGEEGYETWPADAWTRVGGVNAWGGLAIDEARGWVFFGTGSPSYDHYGGNREGANLFGNCVVALDIRNGRRIWHFQAVHHDIWDYDLACPPNLVTIFRDGRLLDAVAQPTKMGHLFILDRETGKPLFPVEERPVPQSDIPGEKTWPTQPFPTKPPPYAQQRFTAADVTDLSPQAADQVRARLSTLRTGSIFLPPSIEGSVALPQFNGGTDWGGAAFDPGNRTLYVNSSSEAEWIAMVKSQPPADIELGELGQRLFGTYCSACHGDLGEEAGANSLSSLRMAVQELPDQEFLQLLTSGRGQMPAFDQLTTDEKRALLAFLSGRAASERIRSEALKLSLADEIPYVATGHHAFRDSEGFPANRRPWGTLTAIDLSRGEFRWQVPLGSYPELERRGLPPTGTFNMGGPLVTAGGLVFIGAAMDEKFRAFDKETGAMLWEYQLEAGGYATPATFEVGGRQYIVIAGGGGGKPETKPGDTYYCFALNGQ